MIKIYRIEIDTKTSDVTYYFEDMPGMPSSEPWSRYEFKSGSRTRKLLEEIEDKLIGFNEAGIE